MYVYRVDNDCWEGASVVNKSSLELVANADGTEAILYIYRGGKFLTTAIGPWATLREQARRDYAGAPLHEIRLPAISVQLPIAA